jgi:hypothetical protein
MANELIEITVNKIGQKAGKKNAWLLTEDEVFYGLPPAMMKEFSLGETCKVEITRSPSKTGGADFLNIVKKIWNGQQNPIKQQVRPATNPVDSDRMATMGMVNAFIAVGAVALDAEEIGNAINVVRAGLHRSAISGAQVQRRDDFDDSIEF